MHGVTLIRGLAFESRTAVNILYQCNCEGEGSLVACHAGAEPVAGNLAKFGLHEGSVKLSTQNE